MILRLLTDFSANRPTVIVLCGIQTTVCTLELAAYISLRAHTSQCDTVTSRGEWCIVVVCLILQVHVKSMRRHKCYCRTANVRD